MSGKKDKESRRVLRKINEVARRANLDVEAERKQLTPLVIKKYNEAINALPLWKRLAVCWRVLWADC